MRSVLFGALAVVVACGDHTSAAARRSAAATDSAYAAVQARGRTAMGVDQYTSTHIFEPLDDGGRIELQRDDADTAGTRQIREHMRQIAASFGAGDFRLPGFVHDRAVPGTGVMAAHRSEITYLVEDLPRGSALRLRAQSPEVVRAIHDFLAFQRQEHHAAAHHGG